MIGTAIPVWKAIPLAIANTPKALYTYTYMYMYIYVGMHILRYTPASLNDEWRAFKRIEPQDAPE